MSKTSKYYKGLSKLSSNELLDILHDCVNLLAPVSPATMAEFDNRSKKQILNRIESGKYMVFEFDGRKWPIINYHLKNQQAEPKNI